MLKCLKWFIILILLFSISVGLFSCRATRLNRSEDINKQDTTNISKTDSVVISKDQSTTEQQNNVVQENTVELELNFEPEDKSVKDDSTKLVIVKDGNDVIETNEVKPPYVDSAKNDDPILEFLNEAIKNPRLKNIKYKGKTFTKDSSSLKTKKDLTDSTHLQKIDSATGKKEIVNIDEDKKQEQFSIWRLLPWYVWLILAILFVILMIYIYKRYVPNFLKPNKNNTT